MFVSSAVFVLCHVGLLGLGLSYIFTVVLVVLLVVLLVVMSECIFILDDIMCLVVVHQNR